jgi:hypothetical protein
LLRLIEAEESSQLPCSLPRGNDVLFVPDCETEEGTRQNNRL